MGFNHRLAVTMAAGVLLSGAAAAAHAAVTTITVSGTVNFASGALKLFGVSAFSLLGKPMTEVYTFDLAKGTVSGMDGNLSITGEGADSPGSVVVTIGGHVLSIDGTRLSYLGYTAASSPLYDTIDGVAETDNGVLFDYAGIEVEDKVQQILANGDLVQNGSYTLTAADNADMYVVGEADCGLSTCKMDQLGGQIDSITFATGAPEPAAWAIMLLGFAGLGAVLRRGRRQGADVPLPV